MVMSSNNSNCVIEQRGKEINLSGDCSVWKPFIPRGTSVPPTEGTTLEVPTNPAMDTSKSLPTSPAQKRTQIAPELALRRTTSDDVRKSPLLEAMQWFFKPIKPQHRSGHSREINVFTPTST